MDVIKFIGRNKRESVKKAMNFYFDNLNDGWEVFLARCRVQPDGKTIHFYPNIKVDLKKYRDFKAKRRKGKK